MLPSRDQPPNTLVGEQWASETRRHWLQDVLSAQLLLLLLLLRLVRLVRLVRPTHTATRYRLLTSMCSPHAAAAWLERGVGTASFAVAPHSHGPSHRAAGQLSAAHPPWVRAGSRSGLGLRVSG